MTPPKASAILCAQCFHTESTSRRGNGTASPVHHPLATPLPPVLIETGVGAEGILPFPWQRPLSSHLLDRLNARCRTLERQELACSQAQAARCSSPFDSGRARGSGFTHSRGGCSALACKQKGVSQLSASHPICHAPAIKIADGASPSSRPPARLTLRPSYVTLSKQSSKKVQIAVRVGHG